MEFITFLLAPIGYAGLTLITVMAWHGRTVPLLSGVTVSIIVLHVLMVWHVRFAWRYSEATRDGLAGFLVFHGALLAIVASTLVAPNVERILLAVGFLVVTFGAIAATAEYEVVRHYRWPVIAIAVAGIIGLLYQPAIALVKRFTN